MKTAKKYHEVREAPYPLTIFFDGDCPICLREINFMRRLNRRGRVNFIDFADPSFDEQTHGLSRPELASLIHARWADGVIIRGVEVFRSMWTAVGLDILAKITRVWFIEQLLIRAYDWFARNRLRLTGRIEPTYGRVKTGPKSDSSACERCKPNKRPS